MKAYNKSWSILSVLILVLFMVSITVLAQPPLRIELSVTNPPPASIVIPLDRPVPGGSYLRIKASGTQSLMLLPVKAVVVEGKALDIVHLHSREEMRKDWNWHINAMSMCTVAVGRDLPKGTPVTVEFNERSSGPLSIYSGLSWSVTLGTVPVPRSLEFEPAGGPMEIAFVPGPPELIVARLKPDGIVMVTWHDAYWNPTTPDVQDVTVSYDGKKVVIPINPFGTNAIAIPVPVSADRVEITDAKGRKSLSNARPVGIDGTPIRFGEFHWHTEFSGDGQRPLSDAMRSARDELALDFAGPGDHIGRTGEYSKNLTPADQAEICKPFEEPENFALIAGAELSGRYGHANIYSATFDEWESLTDRFADELAPMWHEDTYPHEALNKLLPQGRALYIPHHSNMDSYVREKVVRDDGRPYWCAMSFPIAVDGSPLRLFEMCQGRGVFENEMVDPDWGVQFGGLGGECTDRTWTRIPDRIHRRD